MSPRRPEFDLAIIGAGAAGLVAAAGAARLGAHVALVQHGPMGGECLNTGCVPSKALLHAAALAASVRRTIPEAGLAATLAPPDLAAVLAEVRHTISVLAPKDSAERMAALGVEVVAARARFLDPHTLEAGGRSIGARRFLIATGSRPVIPAVPGLGTLPVLTSENLFALAEPVPALLVIGGGRQGAEMAQAFARLGSRVTLLEAQERILPNADAEAAELIANALARDGVEIVADVELLAAGGDPGALWVDYRRRGGQGRHAEGTHLLVAAGRRPAIENLGLKAAGVAIRDGRLVLDARLRTTRRHIYAVGAVAAAGFTHAAERQAQLVLANALFRWPARWRPALVPRVLYTDPELAEVGMSEAAARASGRRYRVWRASFADVDRAVIEHAPEGFVKLIAAPRGRLLGAVISGRAAGELIHETALAVANRRRIAALSRLIHAYPTCAQGVRFAADEYFKAAFTPGRRRVLRFFFGRREVK